MILPKSQLLAYNVYILVSKNDGQRICSLRYYVEGTAVKNRFIKKEYNQYKVRVTEEDITARSLYMEDTYPLWHPV